AVAALADAIKSITGSNDPRVRSRPLQCFPKVLEYRGRFRGERRKVIYGFVDTRRQACGSNVVPEYSPVDHLGEKRRLRDELAHQVGNVFLTFRRKSLLIARPAAEGDHHHLPPGGRSETKGSGTQQGGPPGHSGRRAQKLSPVERN